MMKTALIPAAGAVLLVLVSCAGEKRVPAGSGMIETTEVIVSAETPGRIVHRFTAEGDTVGVGDTIALIDTSVIALRLQQAEASRTAMLTRRRQAQIQIEQTALSESLAGKEFERLERLVKAGSANQQQFDQAENAYQQAQLSHKAAAASLETADAELARIEAETALLRKQLDDSRPTSPLNGTVVTTFIEEGELVTIGKPLVRIARLDTVWVKVYLPPQDLTNIKLGDSAEIDPEDGRAQPLGGTVSWISDKAEFTPKNVQTRESRADLVYAVKIIIPNPQGELKIGMPVSVRIP